MRWLVGIWLRLLRIRWVPGTGWVQGDEILPEFALVGMLMLSIAGALAVLVVLPILIWWSIAP
jgi:hypothetical protein